MLSVPDRGTNCSRRTGCPTGSGTIKGCVSVPLSLEDLKHVIHEQCKIVQVIPRKGVYEAGTHESTPLLKKSLLKKSLLNKFPGAEAAWLFWFVLKPACKNPLSRRPSGAPCTRALVVGCLEVQAEREANRGKPKEDLELQREVEVNHTSPCRALLNDYPQVEVWGVDNTNEPLKFGALVSGTPDHYADLESGRLKLFQQDGAEFVRGCGDEMFDTIHMEAPCSVRRSAKATRRRNRAKIRCLEPEFIEGLFRSLKHGGVLVWNLGMFGKDLIKEVLLSKALQDVGFIVMKRCARVSYYVALKPCVEK